MNRLLKKWGIALAVLMVLALGGCKIDKVDTTPPGPVTNLKASFIGSKIVVTWNNPMDVDFAGVKVECTVYDTKGDSTKDEKLLDKKEQMYEVQDDGTGKKYLFCLTSFDKTGNEGPAVTSDIMEAHVHAFAEAWSKDETNHWHQATCGHEVQDALGAHEWDEGEVTKSPTCSAEGVKTYACTVCNGTKTESIDATGSHSWNAGVVTKAPTCVADGVKTYTCTVCSGTKKESIATTGEHSWNEGTVTKESTCVAEGVKTYTCAVCDSTKTESIAATGVHTWDDGVITKAPCIQVGERTYTCTVCSSTKTEVVPAGHVFNDTSVCIICGYEEDFVLLEASSQNPISFSMGCTAGSSEKNVHTVNLTRGYWICDHEVTQDEYEAITGSNPSYFITNPASGEVQGKRPVETVSWFDAIVYCNKRSVQEGLVPCYSIQDSQGNYTTDTTKWGTVPIGSSESKYARWNLVQCNFDATGYRLPTEAEWEYAARGGSSVTDSRIYSGTTSESSLRTYAWYSDNSSSKTHQVKTKEPNAYGLYDMSGNVGEWCWDWYESSYSTSAQTDPVGAGSGSYRVKRRGSWGSSSDYCSVSDRIGCNPCNCYYRDGYGFRVVRSSSK